VRGESLSGELRRRRKNIIFGGMDLIIENIKSGDDKKLITDLATRLGLKVHAYDQKKEDSALAKAMKKAEKGKMYSKKEALKFLNND
jgi:hypothetical protein